MIFLMSFFLLKISSGNSLNFSKLADETYRKYPNTLTFHVTRSPKDLNWSGTPRDLLWSLLRNKYFYRYITSRAMGHVTVELNCTKDGKNLRRMGGQGAQDLSQFSQHILNGSGFNVILSPEHKQKYPQLRDHAFFNIDGRFETEQELLSEYNHYLREKDLFSLASFILPESSCLKLLSYFDDYLRITKETKDMPIKRAANVYGNGADPLKFEGGGCAPFAVSFLHLSHLEKYIPLMIDKAFVHENLFSIQNKKVSFIDLIFSTHYLNQKTNKTYELSFASPDKLFASINSIFETQPVLEKGVLRDTDVKYVIIDGNK